MIEGVFCGGLNYNENWRRNSLLRVYKRLVSKCLIQLRRSGETRQRRKGNLGVNVQILSQ